ncbi:putative bifunctional diguanylate cyclase/phosphodiesterase [Kineococcus rhizosphaerae]|uniref:Diguanylate cyclase (GGDEF)-like protein n=1 Tax=Kineococcus rhizosphaerae TaxID=559628 RepID=A0A2T0R346_9ACTN|nr:bifunctional diguanylate cyclase/phosphodiesterase [Kineococcus rhizosphaerae]PRY14487.1 diguanylate cyclase (GGDEF)-like protein [Kineococcus rhizosphaerae]
MGVQRSARRSTRRADAVVALVLALVVAGFALPLPAAVTVALLGACGIVGLLGLAVGTLVHRPAPRAAWWTLSGAGLVFLLGVAVRPWALAQDGWVQHLGDFVSLTGYSTLLTALVLLLRAHGGLRRELLTDVLVLTAAGALSALRVLVLPGLAAAGVDRGTAVLAGLFPLVDVVLLGIAADLVISDPRDPRHRLVAAGVLALLVGDVGYSLVDVGANDVPPQVTDAAWAVAYLLLGASALHPARTRSPLTRRPRDDQRRDAWNLPRLLLLGLSLAVVVVAVTWPPAGHRVLYGVASGATLTTVLGLLVFRSVSAVNGQARARAVLHRRASHDDLTDLPNRGEVHRAGAALLATPAPAGTGRWVLFCDLDGFKRVNDRWGHGTGDGLLKVTAQRLRSVAPGALVGRLSGDEFVLVTTGSDADVVALAAAVLESIGRPVPLPAAEVVVTGSVGLARVADGAQGVDRALQDADAAMYRAKGLGRNRWAVFDESMRSDAGDGYDLELALRQAVATDGFDVHYQPVVDVRDGSARGVEALLRWDRPGVGPLSPAVFVPVLEDTGLIVDVGRSVLTRAVTHLARWRASGVVDEDFTMSVNVSPRQLFDTGFAQDLADLLRARDVPGSAVVLELTESCVLEGDDATLRVLHDLRALGVELALDDFGTGYSALSYLRDFPVTRVKVDRSFVNGIGRSPRDEEVVRAVVAVSTALGLALTAEGVETPAQRDAVLAMGVTHGQGWLWARALPPAELAAWLGAGAGAGEKRVPLG